jgi:hypothetical protein
MLDAVAVGLWWASAAASTPVHRKRTLGPIVVDAPAGAACDFALHLEQAAALDHTLHSSLTSKEISFGLRRRPISAQH